VSVQRFSVTERFMLHFAQIFSYGLISGALYGLVALGLSLVFGVMNYLIVAHGALIMMAAYITFWPSFISKSIRSCSSLL